MRIIINTIFALIFTFFGVAGIFSAPEALAWFNDSAETSNSYKAGNLSLDVSGSGFSVSDIKDGETRTKEIDVSSEGSIDPQYGVKTEQVSGELCSNLELTAELDGEQIFSADIRDFSTSSIAIAEETNEWIFKVRRTGGQYMQDKGCSFDLEFNAHQQNLPEGQGFTDSDIISSNIGVAPVGGEDVVINEVMWMGSTESTADEWIELKNTTDSEIDISGWTIQNAGEDNASTTIGDEVIPADGYLLFSNYSKDDENSALDVEADQIDIGISFENDYDENGKLILQNNDGKEINSTPSPENSDWPEGSKEDPHGSMRLVDEEWETCSSTTTDMTDYWDNENNCGTPGHKNLSTDD